MSEAIEAVVMPKWGLAMQEGMLATWLVEEGETVAKGQEIAEIETSKIANVFESPAAGLLRRRVAAEGETLPVGALLAVLAPESVSEEEIDRFVAAFRRRFAEALAAGAGEAIPEPRVVEAGGRRIRCLEVGEGEGTPVVFLHGFGGDLSSWSLNQEALADGRRTIALDLPGHGGSDKRVASGDPAELAAAVADLLDALDVPRAHLVGHSLGGAVALRFALDRPERVAGLTLLAPAGFGEEIENAYLEGFLREKRAKKLRPVLEMLVHDPATISREMVEEVLRYKRLDGVIEALAEIRESCFPGGRQRIELRSRLGDLTMPVQVVWGREDRILPARHAEGLPAGVTVTLFEECGHLPHMEKAAACNALIRNLLERG